MKQKMFTIFKTDGNPRTRTARSAFILLLILLVTLMLSACGTNTGSEDTAGQSTEEPATKPETQEEQTRTVKHDYGESVIPVSPQRIVSIGMEDVLLSLDEPLVQAFSTDGYYLDQQIKEKGIPINSSFDINLEAVASANPDLIIINKYMTDEQGYEQLSKIAPTIAYIRDDWQSWLPEIGKALGKEDKANAILQGYLDKLKEAKESIVQAVGEGKTVAFIRPSTKDVELDFPEWAWTAALYNDVGLQPDPQVLEFQKNSTDDWGGTMLSLEMLPELTADYLFMDYGASMSNEEDFQKDVAQAKEVESLNIWKAIPAVKKGNVYKVSARHWALNGPIADGLKVDDIVSALTEKK